MSASTTGTRSSGAAGAPRVAVHFHGGGDVSAAWPLLVRTRERLRSLASAGGLAVETSIGLNGVLDEAQQRWVVENVGRATVSLDGPPEIQDLHRPLAGGGSSYAHVHATLKAFDAHEFPYGIRATITAQSVGRMEEIVGHLCATFGARHIKLEPMCLRGRGLAADLRPPEARAFVEGFRRARKVARAAGRVLSYSGARMEVLTNVFCQASGESCAVTPEGWVTSCYEVLDPSDPLAGEFFYGRCDLAHRKLVVDEARREALFHRTAERRLECARCFCRWHCAGDCPAKGLGPEGAHLPGATDRCHITRELTLDQLLEALDAPEAGAAPEA